MSFPANVRAFANSLLVTPVNDAEPAKVLPMRFAPEAGEVFTAIPADGTAPIQIERFDDGEDRFVGPFRDHVAADFIGFIPNRHEYYDDMLTERQKAAADQAEIEREDALWMDADALSSAGLGDDDYSAGDVE